VGISSIISNLITMFPRSILTALPSDLFTSFINCLTLLTCSFGRSAALEEVVSYSALIPLFEFSHSVCDVQVHSGVQIQVSGPSYVLISHRASVIVW